MASALLAGCVMAGRAGRTRPAAARASVSPPVHAELEQVTPEAASALALLSFHNDTTHALRVLRFRIRWNGGELVVRPPALTLAAGATLEAPLRIGPEAGDLDALYAQPLGTRVDVLSVARL
jgi:hypothetical protein